MTCWPYHAIKFVAYTGILTDWKEYKQNPRTGGLHQHTYTHTRNTGVAGVNKDLLTAHLHGT